MCLKRRNEGKKINKKLVSYDFGVGILKIGLRNMKKFEINISEVVALYNESGKRGDNQYFSIKYRKAGGVFGEKKCVRRYAGKGSLGDKDPMKHRDIREVEGDAMKFFLIEKDGSYPFEVFIGLVTHLNGQLIDHRR